MAVPVVCPTDAVNAGANSLASGIPVVRRAGLEGLIALPAMCALACLPLGHLGDGRQEAGVPRAHQLPSSRDGEEEKDDGEHALVIDGAQIAR